MFTSPLTGKLNQPNECDDTRSWFCGARVESQVRSRDAGEGAEKTTRYLGSGARTPARRGSAGRATPPSEKPPPTLSIPNWEEDRRWGPARGDLGSRSSPSPPGGGGGAAPKPREAILAAGPPKARAALRAPSLAVSSLQPSGRERPGQPGYRPGLRGRRERGRARGVSRRRDPGGGGAGGEEGKSGEPLPILGCSRRRRRPVGESKVVAGRHFGIFPPAGWALRRARRVGSHGGRRGRGAETPRRERAERERGAGRSRPRRAAAAPPPLPPRTPSPLARPGGGGCRLLPRSLPPTPRASPPPRPGKGPGGDPGGAHYTHHR